MVLKTAASLLLLSRVFASPFEKRITCPAIHVFGARETTAPPGYGSSSTVVNLILAAYPGSTSEAIVYPACGGQASCGDVSYANSALAGVTAAANAVNSFNTECPNTQLVLVGYSQGGQIFDDAFCGGGDTNEGLTNTAVPIQASAINMIKAAIFMGDPRHIPGLTYNVGTCEASGFAPRPAGFICPSGSKIQSYCDAPDPYCCNGNNATTHQGYGAEYGSAALAFVESKLSKTTAPTTTAPVSKSTTVAAPVSTSSAAGGTGPGVAHYDQCGGIGYSGSTTCASPYTCKVISVYYSQCL